MLVVTCELFFRLVLVLVFEPVLRCAIVVVLVELRGFDENLRTGMRFSRLDEGHMSAAFFLVVLGILLIERRLGVREVSRVAHAWISKILARSLLILLFILVAALTRAVLLAAHVYLTDLMVLA